MIRNILILWALIIIILCSCTQEYKGVLPENDIPVLHIYDTADSISNKETKIQWYGNDINGIKMKYYYIVTTDTAVNNSSVLNRFPLDENNPVKWSMTYENYAYISMPFYKLNADTVYEDLRDYGDVITVSGDTVNVTFKAVYSKFFVLGVDEEGERTSIRSKIFKRTNARPKFPMVYSDKLALNGFNNYWMTVGTDSAQLVMPEETEYWKPFDFKWMGEDPDGSDVGLEFRWELVELRQPYQNDTLVAWSHINEWNGTDSVAVPYWGKENESATFSSTIYYHNPNGRYSFRVWVRDDALQESENHSTINFEVFASKFNKGILYIDDTEASLYPTNSYFLRMGNPDNEKTRVFYEQILEDAGYKPDGDTSVDSLKWFKTVKFQRVVDDDGKTYFWPDIKELIKYRLVIISSDDRSTYNGVNFMGETGYAGYRIPLENYLNVGGKIFLIGPSIIQGEKYNMNPPQLPVNQYKPPFEQLFENNIYDDVPEAAGTIPGTNKDVRIFFSKYFGVHHMVFPEQKTYFTRSETDSLQFRPDYYLFDNYDFIGMELYSHISDISSNILRIDSVKANQAWVNSPPLSTGYVIVHELKDRGTVFSGIPTLECFKGEIVYKYLSIFDLPSTDYDPDTTFDYPWENENDTLKHSLLYIDHLTGEPAGTVLRRSGSVATRYIEEGNNFRTAFFTIPLYFMNNSEGQVSEMFSKMIKWFELETKNGNRK